ncbi:MAG: methyltransferase domain-containing protein [Pirellulales bacterium]
MRSLRLHRALRKVPPLFHVGRAIQSAGRTVFGPAWLDRQIKRQVAAGGPIRIVVGSAGVFNEGWISSNAQYLNLLVDAHWQRAFGEHPVDAILAEHVWEHLTLDEGRRAAAQCFKYLRPGGYVRVAVPDGNHPDPTYIQWVDVGGTGAGAYDHKVLYTHDLLRNVFERAGFDVTLLEYYDEAGEFHRVPWDQSAGWIHRCQDRAEKRPDAKPANYTSIILDATKPV